MSDFMCPVCLSPVSQPVKEGTQCSVHPTRLLLPTAYVKAHSDDPYLGLILSDKYELHKSLGHGGFGSVYYAIQRGQIRQAVAVKLLTRQNAAYLDLFRDEMRVVAQLRSPYTVRYLDSGVHYGQERAVQELAYMVMDFLKGETLAHRLIRSGAIEAKQMIPWTIQLLHSLAEAHELGIIHRDLKPLNLMLVEQRGMPARLTVLDFGIARMIDQESREATRNRIMGTPYYLAPEILIKQEVIPQSDLFAVGVILYESLLCHSPFLNEELAGIEPYLRLRNYYRQRRPHDPLPSHFHPAFDEFFKRALDADPQKRFQTADEMIEALQDLEHVVYSNQNTEHTLAVPPSFDTDEGPVTTLFKRSNKEQYNQTSTAVGSSKTSSSSSNRSSLPPPLPSNSSLPPSHRSQPPPLPPSLNSASSAIESQGSFQKSQDNYNRFEDERNDTLMQQPAIHYDSNPPQQVPPSNQATQGTQPIEETSTLPMGSVRLYHEPTNEHLMRPLPARHQKSNSFSLKYIFLIMITIGILGGLGYGLSVYLNHIQNWDPCALHYNATEIPLDPPTKLNPKTSFTVSTRPTSRPCYEEEPGCIDNQIQCNLPTFSLLKSYVKLKDVQDCVEAEVCKEIRPCEDQEKRNNPEICVSHQEAQTYCNFVQMTLPSLSSWYSGYSRKKGKSRHRFKRYEWVQFHPEYWLKVRETRVGEIEARPVEPKTETYARFRCLHL